MSYLGDFNPGDTIDLKFTTVGTDGAPTALSSGAISVYKANSTTQSTAGVTLTADFDSVTGLNHVRITTGSDGTFYATASDFQVVITTGTVGGTSVVGYIVAEFSLQNRTALRPTTAGRTLDVSATGEAGLDWANIGSPTAAQNLSATNIDVDQVVASVSAAVTVGTNNDKTGYSLSAAAVQAIWDALTSALTTVGSIGKLLVDNVNTTISSRLASASYTAPDNATISTINGKLPAALIGGRIDATVGAMQSDVLTSTALAASAVGEIQASILTDATPFQGARIDATISSRLASASYTAPPSAATIADSVWDEALAGHLGAGSTGAALNNAGGGSSPATIAAAVWDEAIAGHLGAGSTGAKLNSVAGGSGSGAIAFTYTLTDSVTTLPIDGASVWCTTDSAGLNIVASGVTNAFGQVIFYLDAGSYYFWQALAGYNFTNPTIEVVS